MIINSITLSNFRQYKGDQAPIYFSSDREKNVTVILGLNTSGKTTLIQAFKWCLYGNCNFKTRDVINVELAKSMGVYTSQEVFVEIKLVHEGKEFTIRRIQKFTKNEYEKIRTEKSELRIQYKESNGEQQAIPPYECDNTINKILPEALSDYFFFDGERIAEINSRGDVAAAVRGLMGLDVVSEAKDRLDPSKASSVISKFSKELDVGSDANNNRYKNDLDEAKNKLEDLIKRRDEAKREIEYFERRKEELSQKLLDNKEEKANQERKISLEKDIIQIEKIITQNESRIISDFNSGSLSFFATPLIERALRVLADAKQVGEGIPAMRKEAIDYILKRGKCICGCDLCKNEGARENIIYEQSLLPPQHIGTTIRNYGQKYMRLKNQSATFASSTRDNLKDYRSNINFLDEKRSDYKSVSEKIKGDINVAKIENDYQTNNSSLKRKNELFNKLCSDIGGTESEISSISKKIESITLVSEKNIKIKKYIAYAQSIYDWLKIGYDKQEQEVREKLLVSVNRIFEKMYHGKRIVTLNDKYEVVLHTLLGNEQISTDESKGLEAVKNFSFISGLVDLARERVQNGASTDSEEILLSSEAYPLVMDAPFSNADEIHIRNISTIIPEIAEQVILIVMNKDWECAKTALESKIGFVYTIEKVNNADTNSIIRRLV